MKRDEAAAESNYRKLVKRTLLLFIILMVVVLLPYILQLKIYTGVYVWNMDLGILVAVIARIVIIVLVIVFNAKSLKMYKEIDKQGGVSRGISTGSG